MTCIGQTESAEETEARLKLEEVERLDIKQKQMQLAFLCHCEECAIRSFPYCRAVSCLSGEGLNCTGGRDLLTHIQDCEASDCVACSQYRLHTILYAKPEHQYVLILVVLMLGVVYYKVRRSPLLCVKQ